MHCPLHSFALLLSLHISPVALHPLFLLPSLILYLTSGVLLAPNIVPPTLQVMGGKGSGRPLTCPKLVHKQADKCLPSTAVVKQKLLSPAVVIAKYAELLVANKAPTLAMKLAREAYFGEEVMAQCTVMGCRDY